MPEKLWQDIRYAVRSLRGSPGFTLAAVLTLALGIGANTAVFSVLKAVLLDDLGYANPDRLVRVYGRTLDGSQDRGPLSAGTVSDVRSRQQSFDRLAAFQSFPADVVVGGAERPRIATVALVEPEFFDVIGVAPERGRMLTSEDIAPETAPVVLTYDGWQRLFAADPAVIGQNLQVNGNSRVVVGVLPQRFVGPMGRVDFYRALDLGPALRDPVIVRRASFLGMVGRLKTTVGHDAAQRELGTIGAELSREYPADNGSLGITGMPLRDAMAGDTRTPLVVLMASAGFVLLLACANLAASLLTRIIRRRREFALRVALGLGRGRLAWQLLSEAFVLALIGGAAGVGVAALALNGVRGFVLTMLPDHADVALDPGAMLVTAVLALATGVVFGILPALLVSRVDLQGKLREDSRGASESRHSRRLRGALVAAQIAICVSLLTGAVLLTRSLLAMVNAPLGFEPSHVLTLALQLTPRDYPTPAAQRRFYEEFLARLRQLPDVESVATGTSVPTEVPQRSSVTRDDVPQANLGLQFVLFASVSDDYFRTLRIPLQQGRTFDDRDRPGPEGAPVAIISQSMANRYWPAGNPIGARMRMGPDPKSPLVEVIGVVGDVRNDLTQPEAEPMVYRPSRQFTWPFARLLLRTKGDPLDVLKSVDRELAALNPGLVLDRVEPLSAVVTDGFAGRRLPTVLMSAFGVLALLLACVGVYAMFSSMVLARELEFGIRLAFGSPRHIIACLVVRQGAGWLAAGLAGGALGGLAVVGLVRDLLYHVAPSDPLSITIAIALLIACASSALLIPLRRAIRVDPIHLLRAQ
jgi:putative ABC transport system permease protein